MTRRGEGSRGTGQTFQSDALARQGGGGCQPHRSSTGFCLEPAAGWAALPTPTPTLGSWDLPSGAGGGVRCSTPPALAQHTHQGTRAGTSANPPASADPGLDHLSGMHIGVAPSPLKDPSLLPQALPQSSSASWLSTQGLGIRGRCVPLCPSPRPQIWALLMQKPGARQGCRAVPSTYNALPALHIQLATGCHPEAVWLSSSGVGAAGTPLPHPHE